MKGNKYMKVLKIEDKKCYFSTDGLNYTPIVDISKEDIYLILDIIYNDDGTIIDEADEDTEIVNDVEKIIYTNIYEQLEKFIQNKSTLKSEINDELKEVKEKYKINEESVNDSKSIEVERLNNGSPEDELQTV